MFKMTISDALSRQARQGLHYGHLHAGGIDGLRAQVAEATNIDPDIDPNAMICVIEINRMIPRGSSIEQMLSVDFGGD